MPRRAKELSAIEVKRLSSGVHPVGGVPGLYLQVTEGGGRSWLLRTPVGGKRREIGLGSYPEVSLKDARLSASENKAKIRQGINPIEERKQLRKSLSDQAKQSISFRDAFEQYVPIKQSELSKGSHRKNWRNSVDEYAMAVLGAKSTSEIDTNHIVEVLRPIWSEKRATADKLRRKLRATLVFCAAKGYRESDNPAEWTGKLSNLLPKSADGSDEQHFPAVQLRDVQRCWQAIQSRTGISKLALSFQFLTATRTGAVRFMTWDEVDFDNMVWTVQPLRRSSKVTRKMGPRRVPLTEAMKDILDRVPRHAGSKYVFVAPRGGALSDASIAAVLKKTHDADVRNGNRGFLDAQSGEVAVPHGFRSTMKDWVSERTSYEWNLSEAALWHYLGSKVEQAYARSDVIEKRRKMMADWNDFVRGVKV